MTAPSIPAERAATARQQKPTPGPWYLGEHETIEDARGHLIGDARTEVDARLMAAAPELYEALKEVVAISDRKHDAWGKAHAALAKAEGR